MTDTLKHVSISARIVSPAPHPQGAPLDPREYYMADARGEQLLLAHPGVTHLVVYWLDTSGSELSILYEACETVSKATSVINRHLNAFVGFSPQDVIEQMEKALEQIKKLTLPAPETFQGMPYLGQTVWVIAPNGKVVPVRVTEIAEMSGEMCVIFGFHYKPNGQWFWTQEAAETYAADPAAQTGPKNVFLGEMS